LQLLLSATLISSHGILGATIGYTASMLCLFFIQVQLLFKLSTGNIQRSPPCQDDIPHSVLAYYIDWRATAIGETAERNTDGGLKKI
jgi:hypothetical protein